MRRFESPKLARDKAERLRRERRKENGFLIFVIVLMAVVAVAYGVWAFHRMKDHMKQPHRHSEKTPSEERSK